MLNDHDIHFLDVIGLIDDPDVGLLNGHNARFLGEHILSPRDDGRRAVRVLDIGSS